MQIMFTLPKSSTNERLKLDGTLIRSYIQKGTERLPFPLNGNIQAEVGEGDVGCGRDEMTSNREFDVFHPV